MSDSVRPHRRQPTRLLCPWDSPGKNTGVGCHFLLQCVKVKSESRVAQSCLTLSDLMDCNLLGSSGHGIFQARVLEWSPLPSLLEWLNLRRLALPGVSEDMERLEISHIVDRNANGTVILENSTAVLIKLPYNTAIPLLAIYPKERQTSICSHTKILSCWLCWRGLPSRGQSAVCWQGIFSHHKGDI